MPHASPRRQHARFLKKRDFCNTYQAVAKWRLGQLSWHRDAIDQLVSLANKLRVTINRHGSAEGQRQGAACWDAGMAAVVLPPEPYTNKGLIWTSWGTTNIPVHLSHRPWYDAKVPKGMEGSLMGSEAAAA